MAHDGDLRGTFAGAASADAAAVFVDAVPLDLERVAASAFRFSASPPLPDKVEAAGFESFRFLRASVLRGTALALVKQDSVSFFF